MPIDRFMGWVRRTTACSLAMVVPAACVTFLIDPARGEEASRPSASVPRRGSALGRILRGGKDRPAESQGGTEGVPVDPRVARTQGPIPPKPPASPGRGEAGPATPPLPDAATMPSGPVVPPRRSPTAAPIPGDRPDQATSPITPPLPAPEPPQGGEATRTVMGLADFEQMALAWNPTLAQAAAVVGVSRGRAWQAGLWPNPLVGYQGEHMGAHGPGSKYGPAALGEHQALFFQQEIPTAARQRVSRRKFEWEAESARKYAEAQQLRVLNSVRIHFFQTLGEQQLVEDRRELFEIADAALRTTEEMVNDGQANATDLLQAQIQQQQARIAVVRAENHLRQSWVNLVAEAGRRGLPTTRLEGPLDAGSPPLDFDATLDFIRENSPEIKAALAEIKRDEIVVHRERIQPIPNLFVRADVGPNFIDGGTTTSLTLWGNIPVWNKNQGTIYQANSHLQQAQANLRRIELSIEQRLATQMSDYNSALVTVTTYRDESLPRAKKAYELLLESYQRRRAAWPQVLVAQRMWFELQVEYVHALVDLRRSEIEIKGFLLTGGLQLPQTPEPLGNINVSPNPR